MSICQIEEREAGRSYPRTCPTCRLGPCSKGHDYKSMQEQIATQAAEIERLTRERDTFYEKFGAEVRAHLAVRKMLTEESARATAAEAERDALRGLLWYGSQVQRTGGNWFL